MKITQEVRDYANNLAVENQTIAVSELNQDVAEQGMQKMSAQFRELGSDVYLTTDKLQADNQP
jgi:phosphomethylpyrimidine synthase